MREITFEDLLARRDLGIKDRAYVEYPKYGKCRIEKVFDTRTTVVELNIAPNSTPPESLRITMLRKIPGGTENEKESYARNHPIFIDGFEM